MIVTESDMSILKKVWNQYYFFLPLGYDKNVMFFLTVNYYKKNISYKYNYDLKSDHNIREKIKGTLYQNKPDKAS